MEAGASHTQAVAAVADLLAAANRSRPRGSVADWSSKEVAATLSLPHETVNHILACLQEIGRVDQDHVSTWAQPDRDGRARHRSRHIRPFAGPRCDRRTCTNLFRVSFNHIHPALGRPQRNKKRNIPATSLWHNRPCKENAARSRDRSAHWQGCNTHVFIA